MNTEDPITYRNRLKARKQQLETDIMTLIKQFQAETALRVTDIDLDVVPGYDEHGPGGVLSSFRSRGTTMSSSETLGTKKLSDIIVGDRIAFKANQLVNWETNYCKPHIALTATVIRIEVVEGKRQLVTASGRLNAYPDDMEFEVVGSDFDTTATQMQYAVAAPEKVNGISIE